MSLSEEQPSNAQPFKSSTLSGTTTWSSFVQPLNARAPMVRRFDGNSMVSRDVHSAKATEPMAVSASVNVIFFRLLQPLNAQSPMLWTLSGNTSSSMSVRSQ